jgi:3-deoxy-D-manno-octulosonic-acid transferase
MILAQSNVDRERFLALGAKQNQVMVSGNVKFDLEIPLDLIDQTVKLRSLLGDNRPIWVAASTHSGEEIKLLSTAKAVLEQMPTALLILVPRHPERFGEVLALCQREGFNVTPCSKLEQYSATTEILLGDVMGKLLLFYGVSDIAFVGGSLIPWGGHNVLEPAALAKPVLSGKHLHAFAEISQIMIDRDALVIVNDESALAEKLIALFQDKTQREQLGTAALDIVERHRGSTEKILEVIKNLVAVDAN